MERTYILASRIFPSRVNRSISDLLRYCGSTMTAETWLGRAAIISIIIFVLTAAVFLFTVQNPLMALFLVLVGLLIFHVANYMLLYLKAESRARAVERVLPNLLQLIAANLNSGMTPFQAVKEASRIEFGILKEEIDTAIALSLGTMPFPDALMYMTTKVKSETFRNVMELFVEGMRTGGPLATLLNDIADDIIENLDLRREIVTRSKSYILFISFIVVVGAPLLSAVSIHFIRTITSITSTVALDVPEVANVGGITFGQLSLTESFLTTVSVANILVTALIASWLIAIIAEGRDKYMFKYAIMLVPFSMVMFYSLDYLIALVLTVE